VLRGLHYHRRQLDYWTVVGGRALVALVDVRPVLADPSAHEVVETRELSEGETVTIPRAWPMAFWPWSRSRCSI